MFRLFYPYEYVESVFTIDYQKLYDKGYRGLIFDIDNTLVPHGADSTEEVDRFFQSVQEIGFRTLLLTNNDEERILRFLKNIDSLYIPDAEKPKTGGYLRALEMLGLTNGETVFIGDQVFTDILGANRSRIASILVKFIGYKTETRIGIRRNLEKIILKFYMWNRRARHRLGDIEKKEAETNAVLER